ncbi:MAG: hypothetical protein QM784_03515 [Polyangiaceae bacterium]
MRRGELGVFPYLLLGSLWSCSAQLRLAPTTKLPDIVATDRPGSVVVGFPPPPARVEVVPPPPDNPECVWLDGQWRFDGQDYAWIAGAWVHRLPGCAFAKARFFWDDVPPNPAILRYRIGHWVIPAPPYTECPAPAPCTATEP